MSELVKPLPPLGSVAVLRSVLIGIALAVSVLKAVPARPLRAEQLLRPDNAHAISGLEHALSSVGVTVSSQSIRDGLLGSSRRLHRARRAVLRFVAPVFDELGMRQRWALFTSRGRRSFRIHIEAMHADQRWHTVYRAHELDLLGLAPKLTFRRLRGIYDPRDDAEPKAQYDTFASWLAQDLLAAHPDFVGVRISMDSLRVGSPSEPTKQTSVEHVRETYRPGTP